MGEVVDTFLTNNSDKNILNISVHVSSLNPRNYTVFKELFSTTKHSELILHILWMHYPEQFGLSTNLCIFCRNFLQKYLVPSPCTPSACLIYFPPQLEISQNAVLYPRSVCAASICCFHVRLRWEESCSLTSENKVLQSETAGLRRFPKLWLHCILVYWSSCQWINWPLSCDGCIHSLLVEYW